MVVRKRDGRLVDFDSDKILESIKKAALAVEGKDEDIQRKSNEIKNLKRQLIKHGFPDDVAEQQAEEQFEGYLEDGNYTEYDEEEAEDILKLVNEAIDGMDLDDDEIIDTDTIQDLVEKAMMETGHAKTAREYIIKRANRERIREMNTSLMRSFEDLTFGKSEEVETKRENANIDGDSAMGTMLKYGSEGAKKFNLLYIVPPEESEAHSNGDIHIHDLDFMALTETCMSGSTELRIKIGNSLEDWDNISIDKAHDIDRYFKDKEVGCKDISKENLFIRSWSQLTKVNKVMRHSGKGKKMYTILLHGVDDTIELTGEHKIPVALVKGTNSSLDCPEFNRIFTQENEGKTWELRRVDSLPYQPLQLDDTIADDDIDITFTVLLGQMIGADDDEEDEDTEIEDSLADEDGFIRGTFTTEASIISVRDCRDDEYVYDIETENHYFNICDEFIVHNCCQIDIEKLFNGGFNTGHGFLREPGEIRSYAALACIAIQSNQNDQHKRVA